MANKNAMNVSKVAMDHVKARSDFFELIKLPQMEGDAMFIIVNC